MNLLLAYIVHLSYTQGDVIVDILDLHIIFIVKLERQLH